MPRIATAGAGTDDAAYHRARAAQERRAATRARHSRARATHLHLAQAHEALERAGARPTREAGTDTLLLRVIGHALRACAPPPREGRGAQVIAVTKARPPASP